MVSIIRFCSIKTFLWSIAFSLLVVTGPSLAEQTQQQVNSLYVDHDGQSDLLPYIYFVESENLNSTIEEISDLRNREQFKPWTESVVSTSAEDKALWLRIELDLADDLDLKELDWVVVMDSQPFTRQLFYFETLAGKNNFRRVETGGLYPASLRDFDSPFLAFNVRLKLGEKKTVYFKVVNRPKVAVPLKLMPRSLLYKQEVRSIIFLASFYSIMGAFFIYNFFLYLKIREKAYLYYLICILGSVISSSLVDGVAVHSQVLRVIGSTPSIFIILAFFHLLFISSSLRVNEVFPRVEKIYKAFYIATGLTVFYCLFYKNPEHIVVDVVSGGVAALNLTVIFLAFRKKIPIAFPLLLAEMCPIIGAMFFNFALYQNKAFIGGLWGLHLGFAFELALFSLVLGQRASDAIKTAVESERQKLEAQAEAIEAYASSLKLKNDFLMAISHELRTPMHGIIGGVQLAKEKSKGESKGLFEIIQSSAEDMMTLVNDILAYTEIQAGQLKLKSEVVDGLGLLKLLKERYTKLCDEKSLKLTWNIDAGFPEKLALDKNKLHIVLEKLLDNAVKFTESGEIKFSARKSFKNEQPYVTFHIHDTGVGIEDTTNVFDAFKQNESGFKRRYGGLGIGLTISQELVKKMNGKLDLTSSLHGGTHICVKLPMDEVRVTRAEEVKSTEKALQKVKNNQIGDGRSESLPILIVEDNLVNQKIMIKMLQRIGFDSSIAEHGQEALAEMEMNEFSLVLMDLQMPVMDGFECAEKIRARGDAAKDIPIIAVSANLMDVDQERCEEIGMNDWMKKPVSMNNLQETIYRYLQP